jgi:hypothetical protein
VSHLNSPLHILLYRDLPLTCLPEPVLATGARWCFVRLRHSLFPFTLKG